VNNLCKKRCPCLRASLIPRGADCETMFDKLFVL
jgi:hypothetical protein